MRSTMTGISSHRRSPRQPDIAPTAPPLPRSRSRRRRLQPRSESTPPGPARHTGSAVDRGVRSCRWRVCRASRESAPQSRRTQSRVVQGAGSSRVQGRPGSRVVQGAGCPTARASGTSQARLLALRVFLRDVAVCGPNGQQVLLPENAKKRLPRPSSPTDGPPLEMRSPCEQTAQLRSGRHCERTARVLRRGLCGERRDLAALGEA
jgi:hypothetical protein